MRQLNINFGNYWGGFFLLFFMAITSVTTSITMDKRLYKQQKNNSELEEVKARFTMTRQQLMSSKRNIMSRAKVFEFYSYKENTISIHE